jgi:hypothetical protein
MMKAYKTLIFTLMVLACLLIAATNSRAQNNLGWNTFDFGADQDLGASLLIFDGAMEISAQVGIDSAYQHVPPGADTLWGSAGSLSYLHSDNWLVGGIGSSLGGIQGGAVGPSSELVFRFNGEARLDSMALTISGLDFGLSPFDPGTGYNLDADDPMMWLKTNAGIFSITEQEMVSATSFFLDGTTAGAENGYVDFAYFTSKMGFDTAVYSFGLRETNEAIHVKDIYVGDFTAAPVPEPGSALLLALSGFWLLRRRR